MPVTYTVSTERKDLDTAAESAKGEWGSSAAADLFNGSSYGSYSWGVRDNRNYITCGNHPTAGVIAVTATWYSRATKTAIESKFYSIPILPGEMGKRIHHSGTYGISRPMKSGTR